MTIAYDFNEQKKSGAYGERYLDDFFSRWYAITPASPLQQRQGIDRLERKLNLVLSHLGISFE